jgi:hypothetical protein
MVDEIDHPVAIKLAGRRDAPVIQDRDHRTESPIAVPELVSKFDTAAIL